MPKTFLIVEDTEDKRLFLAGILERMRWDGEILIARTTEEAMEFIKAAPISAAFVDYNIPSQNGPAVIKALRARHPKAHIALTTATDSKRYKEDAMAAGADAFVCTSWPEDRAALALQDLITEWQQ